MGIFTFQLLYSIGGARVKSLVKSGSSLAMIKSMKNVLDGL